jgi:hypothetical protein
VQYCKSPAKISASSERMQFIESETSPVVIATNAILRNSAFSGFQPPA